MDGAAITAKLKGRFALLDTYAFRGQHAVTLTPELLRDVAVFLRDEPELQFNFLMDVGGVDYLGYDEREHRFEVVYQFYSLPLNHRFRVKVAVRDESVSVPSVWDLWGIANWMEREVWDLFGIVFTGHPNLRRIMCHDDFVGHALRKDYPIARRQKLTRPSESILCDKSELA